MFELYIGWANDRREKSTKIDVETETNWPIFTVIVFKYVQKKKNNQQTLAQSMPRNYVNTEKK